MSSVTTQGTQRGTTESAGADGFRRDVGLLGLTSVSLGAIIGSGWLLGAQNAAVVAGPGSLISWILGGVILSSLALVHAELGSTYPVTGGTARFPHFAFGSIPGFVCGWMSWLGTAAIAPVEVEAALTYTNNKIPGLVHADKTLTPEGIAVATGLMLIFTAVNVIGIRRMSDSNTVTVLWKLAIPLITIVALFVLVHHGGNFTAGGGFAPYGVKGIFLAIPIGVVFSLQGFEQATQLGGEARNPQRDMPRAVIGSMAIGVVVYLLLELVFIGSLNPAHLVHGWANPIGAGNFGPYATIATSVGATWLAVLLYIDAFVSPAGTGLIYIGTSSRVSYALSDNRYLPPFLSKVSSRGVPLLSILLSFVIGEIAFLPFPSWTSLVSVISSASALLYAFGPVSLMALRHRDPDRERPYRLPMAGVICPLSFVAANYIVYWAGWTTLWKLYIGLGIGLVLFAASYAFSPQRRPITSVRSAAWVPPWLIGIGVITWLGQYDGARDTIPFWWDLSVVAVFALAIYTLAVHLAMPADEVKAAIGREEDSSHAASSQTYPA
jgi:amino acid transporter